MRDTRSTEFIINAVTVVQTVAYDVFRSGDYTRRTKIQPRRTRVGARLDEFARYLREDEYWYRIGDTRRSCARARRQCCGSGIHAIDQR